VYIVLLFTVPDAATELTDAMIGSEQPPSAYSLEIVGQ
jgi:hypothetical protein